MWGIVGAAVQGAAMGAPPSQPGRMTSSACAGGGGGGDTLKHGTRWRQQLGMPGREPACADGISYGWWASM